MTGIYRKKLCGIFSFVLALWVVIAGIFSAILPILVKAATILSYEQTSVTDDLKNATINGKPFDWTEYSFDENKETQVLTLAEYCYSFYENMQDGYGLYIYVYNPQGLSFDVNSPLNTVQLAYGVSSSTGYIKYPLRFLNYSTETNYERLFYKFKILFSQNEKTEMLSALNSNARIYRVSGIELLEKGQTNATEFPVSTTYTYSGYAAGYGSNPSAENTLACKSEETETLVLNVYPTQYRPDGTNGKNEYTQDSLHSVYFAVPNEIIQKYGAMSAIHATWLNAVLKPALVTGNPTAYEAIRPLLGKSIKALSTFEYMYLGAYGYQENGESGALYLSGYSYYNEEPLMRNDKVLNDRFGKDIETLYLMYCAESGTDGADNYTVSSGEILADLKASEIKYGGSLVNGKYSEYLFESIAKDWADVNIKADETFSLTDEIIDKSWWDKFWDLKGEITTNTFDGIKAIYAVKESDMSGSAAEVAKRLYISEADYAEFSNFYNANKAENAIYLFRYQVSDYIAQEATLLQENTSIFGDSFKKVDTNAYFFQQTVNLDFDIIDVTFSNGEKDTVIPVVSNPIDVVPDATPPVYTQSDRKIDWRFMLITVIFLTVLIICFPQVLAGLIKGSVRIISGVFKRIGQAMNKRKERKKNDEKG